MANLDTLISAGVIPHDHTLTKDDIKTVNSLAPTEVDTLITLKSKLGDEFLQRNTIAKPNCFL
jgi:hypothetical protein